MLRSDYREKVRFLRGYVQSLGFRSTVLRYAAGERAAGHSKYSIRKLFRFSMNTIMSFSELPLRLGIYAGVGSALLGMAILVYSLIMKVKNGAPDGYTTLIVVICFMFAVLFLLLGIIGQYIGVLFQEIKGRPIYIVEERLNFEGKSEKLLIEERGIKEFPQGQLKAGGDALQGGERGVSLSLEVLFIAELMDAEQECTGGDQACTSCFAFFSPSPVLLHCGAGALARSSLR